MNAPFTPPVVMLLKNNHENVGKVAQHMFDKVTTDVTSELQFIERLLELFTITEITDKSNGKTYKINSDLMHDAINHLCEYLLNNPATPGAFNIGHRVLAGIAIGAIQKQNPHQQQCAVTQHAGTYGFIIPHTKYRFWISQATVIKTTNAYLQFNQGK